MQDMNSAFIVNLKDPFSFGWQQDPSNQTKSCWISFTFNSGLGNLLEESCNGPTAHCSLSVLSYWGHVSCENSCSGIKLTASNCLCVRMISPLSVGSHEPTGGWRGIRRALTYFLCLYIRYILNLFFMLNQGKHPWFKNPQVSWVHLDVA